MTKAVIRPDYFSGPAMAEDFGDFSMILQAAEAGIVILDPNVLVPIFKADYWVFDDTVPWRFTRASEELLESLDQNHDREIVFLSRRGSQQIVERDGGVRFSRLDTGGSSAAKKAFIAQRQAYGQSVVYFGDCQRESALAATADVAVTVADRRPSGKCRGAHRLSVSGSGEVQLPSFALCKAKCPGQKRVRDGNDTKRRSDNCRRDSQCTRLGFGLNDDPRGSYLLSSRLSAAAPSSRVVGARQSAREGSRLVPRIAGCEPCVGWPRKTLPIFDENTRRWMWHGLAARGDARPPQGLCRGAARPAPCETSLALTAALVTGVERVGMPLFYEIDSFHGAAEGADGDSDQFEALDFMVRVNCG